MKINAVAIIFYFVLLPGLCTIAEVRGQSIKILSETDKLPVDKAQIHLKSLTGEKLEITLITDSNCVVTIPASLRKSKARVMVLAIGYALLTDTLLPGSNPVYYLKEHYLQQKEVVVTGQYSTGSIEKAVQKIKIIDRKKIDAMSAQNLRDVLANEMNIRISQDNILGSGLSMQGISGQNVKILVDGVPVVGRQDGNIDLSQINLNNIERIEVVEGPMSVNYGTDALAGTINLITKKSQHHKIESSLSSYYESIGNYNVTGRLGRHKLKNTVSLSGGRNFFDGWNPGNKIYNFSSKPRLADSSRFSQWKPREQYFGDLQFIHRFKNLSFNYKGSYFYEQIMNRGLPRLPYGETAFDDYYNTYRTDNAAYVQGKFAKNRNFNVQLAYNDYRRIKNTYYKDLTSLNQSLSNNPGDQDTSRFGQINSRATYSMSRDSVKLNYELGYDINVETAYGARIKNKTQNRGDYATFASAEYRPFNSLTLRPGLRYSYNTSYNAPLTPSLNLRWKLSKSLIARASYSKGFRSPSLKEQYFYFVDINHNIKGSENLKAEYSDNYNLSLNYSKLKGNKLFKAEASVFYNDIQNLITLAQSAGTEYTYINIGKYKTNGVQANGEAIMANWKFSLGASYTGRYNALSELENIETYTYSPEWRSNIYYVFKKQALTLALFYKYSGRLPGYAMDANNKIARTYISAYQMADFSISKPFWDKRVNLSIGAKNLFDIKNINATMAGSAHSSGSSSTPMATGRSYFLRLDINLNHK